MEHHDDAGLGTEIAPVLRKGEQCPGSGIKEQPIEQLLVGKEQSIELMRQRKDDMEVAYVKDLTSSLVDPYLLENGLAVWA